jgi:hypothetical protein
VRDKRLALWGTRSTSFSGGMAAAAPPRTDAGRVWCFTTEFFGEGAYDDLRLVDRIKRYLAIADSGGNLIIVSHGF